MMLTQAVEGDHAITIGELRRVLTQAPAEYGLPYSLRLIRSVASALAEGRRAYEEQARLSRIEGR